MAKKKKVPTRYARITRSKTDEDPGAAVANYLPANYRVLDVLAHDVLVAGEDNCGWTLDDYVLPRLASGLRFGEEVDAKRVQELMLEDVALVEGLVAA